MTPSRPYLLRAFYEWIVDNHSTPYIVVSADLPGVDVPREYVDNGRIILNISPNAVRGLLLENNHVVFNARFGGTAYDVYIPMRAITAIYAKENGRGMVFKEEEDFRTEEGAHAGGRGPKGIGPGPKKGGGKKGGPKLTVVK